MVTLSVIREHLPKGRLGTSLALIGSSNLIVFLLGGCLAGLVPETSAADLPMTDFDEKKMVCCSLSSDMPDELLMKKSLYVRGGGFLLEVFFARGRGVMISSLEDSSELDCGCVYDIRFGKKGSAEYNSGLLERLSSEEVSSFSLHVKSGIPIDGGFTSQAEIL